ncbi:MAG TPA: PfkB family carbohydrate kinase [Methylomirabilota bacterium]|nr:PfkB family carbohydrate kinase [Methylomirabilota bacterium]
MPPDLVVAGHVTLDVTSGGTRPGGAAYYAALAAHRLGLRVGLLTSFGDDFPPDTIPSDILVAKVDSPRSTTFTLTGTGSSRTLTLGARAADLETDDLPPDWTASPLALLCPVINEVDPALAESLGAASLGVLPQGWMRRREQGGRIVAQPWEEAEAVLAWAQLMVASEEDVTGFREDAVEWLQRVPLGALTAGVRGATLFVNGEPYHVSPDVATAVDDTGAGDVFAATLLTEYHRNGDPWEAAAAAAVASAAAVEGKGASSLLDRAALTTRLAEYRRRRGG